MESCVAIVIDNLHPIEPIIALHEPYLPKGCDIYHLSKEDVNSIADYNRLMTSKRLWRNLKQFERVITIQWDSQILTHGIEDFFKWDYIGAPWKFQQHGGNGGFSIRNPQTMLKIIDQGNYTGNPNEDVYYCNEMLRLGMNLAPRIECEKFSVEAIYKLGTIGLHAIDSWLTVSECESIRNQYL